MKTATQTKATFFSAQKRQEVYGGGKMLGTECGHQHRTIRTADKCAFKRNPTAAPGTMNIGVFRRNPDGSYDDRYAGMSPKEIDAYEAVRWDGLECQW